jgi:hypothetical protein
MAIYISGRTSYNPRTTKNGLLLYLDAANVRSYPGSGNIIYDLNSNNSTNTLVNSPSFSTQNNGIISLDGINEYISVDGSVTSTLLSPSVATFSIWFRPSSNVLNGRANSLISRGNYNTSGGFFIHMYTNTVSNNAPGVAASFSYSTTNNYSFNGTSQYALRGFNVWSNVTVVCDSQISLYIDGQHKETASRTSVSTIIYGNGTINTNGDTNLILCSTLSYVPVYSDGFWEPYKGDFANFQMWNRRLTATEILQNYNTLKSRFI